MISRKADGIGWVLFNDPQAMNAISMEMSAAIPEIIAAHDADPDIRVVILTGVGDRAFAAGSNISAFGRVRTNAAQNKAYHGLNEQSYNSVYECSKPTIAMIRGYCMGGGVDYAASCDIRIAADDAVFAVPAARLGLGYGYEGKFASIVLSVRHKLGICFSPRVATMRGRPFGLAWSTKSSRLQSWSRTPLPMQRWSLPMRR
nr:enoyl-CoA hydratase-related protein [Cupriavidus taiwanensis]